jgi:hypothetical protein
MTTGEFTQAEQDGRTEDGGAISQLAGEAQQQAQQLGAQAQEKVQEAATEAKGRLREQLDRRSSDVAKQINGQASDLHAVSESLRQNGKDGPAQAADALARHAERIGGYLRDKDSAALLADAEDLARRQPLAVGLGALALGFAASRFLKASSRSRYSSRAASPPSSGGAAPGPLTPSPAMPRPNDAGPPLSDDPMVPPPAGPFAGGSGV